MITDNNNAKRLWLVAAIIILPILGYVAMRALPEMFNNDGGDTGLHIAVYVLLIAIALSIPYLMLKSGMKSAKMGDYRERDLELKDLPQDKEQIARKS